MRELPILIVLAGVLVARPSFAADSSWLLCKGIADTDGKKQHIVVSALEHRATNGTDRDLDVTLVRGTHASRGVVHKLETDKPMPIRSKTIAGNGVVFAGKLVLAGSMTTLTLDGTLDRAKVTASLTCEILDDLAIGH